ncbi:hypothetical protein F5887DRAFT_1287651 [Amanita rubescens]|nr:hypothetical protein F5887DRAFT_1287651 [Amanita rubescens]
MRSLSLIELAVRYARERDPVCERYKGVCDNFLTTISSMQSEMEQIFGTTKRSPKSKASQTILSSYQFRMINEVMRQALTLSSPVPPSTGLLSNSRGVAISGGTFTDIQGNLNQYVRQTYPVYMMLTMTSFVGSSIAMEAADIQTLLNDMAGRMDDLDFSDYSVLKYGDLRAISTPRRRYQRTWHHDVDEQDPFQEYTVAIHNQIMTARTYRGKSALQSFKNDAKMILEHNFRRVMSSFSVEIIPSQGFMKTPAFCSAFWLSYLIDENIQHGELQAAFRYLMQELQLGQPTSPAVQLTSEGQFLSVALVQETLESYCILPEDVDFDNCSCHLYVDNCQRLRVSIESVNGRTYWGSMMQFPKLSSHDTEAMKDTLLMSNGIKSDGYQIDKKAYLLAIYRHIIWTHYGGYSFMRSPRESPIMLISPMRRARAVRLAFNREYRFTWHGWNWSIDDGGSDVELSQVAIDNISWTCFTIPHDDSFGRQAVCCRSRFDAPSLYLETFLAQGERMLSQIQLSCTTCKDVEIVTGVNCEVFFQSRFSPISPFPAPHAVFIFVKDLQDVDDAFEISWFWAKDRTGLNRLSPDDMRALGLRKPRQSRIYVETWELQPRILEDLRVFHEIFGFAADSPDIPRSLDLPVASVEWDGDEDGPLTPWEAITMNWNEYYNNVPLSLTLEL